MPRPDIPAPVPRPPEHNKAGHQEPTQKNEPKRTTESRHDFESQLGSSNQTQSRRGVTSGRH